MYLYRSEGNKNFTRHLYKLHKISKNISYFSCGIGLLSSCEDDCLWIIRSVLLKPMDIFFIRLMSWLILIYHVVIIGGECYYLMKNFDVDLFIQYAPLTFGCIYGYIAMASSIYAYYPVLNHCQTMYRDFWPPSKAGKELETQILREARILRLAAFFNYGLAIIVTIFMQPIFGFEDSYNFAIFYSNKNFQPWSPVLNIAYYCSFVAIFLHISGQSVFLSYMFIHAKFQLMLLRGMIDNIPQHLPHTAINIFYDQSCQDLIYHKLCDCIRHHIIIRRFCVKGADIISLPIIFQSCAGTLSGMSVLYFILSQSTLTSLPRASALIAITCTSIALFTTTGQGLLDESENLVASLYALPWYSFDQRNKKTLLIFLTNCMEPLRISATEVIVLDYSLPAKLFQSLYSAYTMISKMALRRKKAKI